MFAVIELYLVCYSQCFVCIATHSYVCIGTCEREFLLHHSSEMCVWCVNLKYVIIIVRKKLYMKMTQE